MSSSHPVSNANAMSSGLMIHFNGKMEKINRKKIFMNIFLLSEFFTQFVVAVKQ